MRVVVVSTHRSDKAHYAPLLRCLRATPELEVVLYAVNDFYKRPDYNRSIQLDRAQQGKNARGFDAGIVLGDRYEMLVAAAQLVEARIPLLHIHGGEHTYGSLDERWRWAMTMMADVHCVATEDAQREIFEANNWSRMGTVHVTGAPGLDDIHDRQPFPNAPKIVVLYNPAIDEETTVREATAIHDAIAGLDVGIIQPNGDRFSDVIRSVLGSGYECDSEKFRDLLAAAQVIVGNSSAGIIEAPSLGTWTVNVGERQAGRPRAHSVGDASADAASIRQQIEHALGNHRAQVANPYGDGHASERIRDVLVEMGK